MQSIRDLTLYKFLMNHLPINYQEKEQSGYIPNSFTWVNINPTAF